MNIIEKYEKVIKHTSNPGYVIQQFKILYDTNIYVLQLSTNFHFKYRILNKQNNLYVDFGLCHEIDYSYHRNDSLKMIYQSYNILNKYANKMTREYLEYYLLYS